MKTQIKGWLSKTLVLFTALFAVQSLMAADGPYELTQKAADKLFADLKANNAQIKANPEMLKTLVRENLMPHVHVNYAGSLVLGQYFRTTTPEQREKFFAAFGQFIEQAYAQALTLYSGQELQIQPAQFEGNNAKVAVKLIQNQPLYLTFFWRQNSKTGKWQVYDMTGAGASMVDTKKQEWSGILRKEGIEGLTAQVLKAAAEPVVFKK